MAKSKWPQVQDKLALVEKWARDGLIEEQIAKNLGISRSTLELYKKDHPDFLDAIKKGKEPFIAEVENALAKRALGYFYEETKTYIKEEDGSEVRYSEIQRKYQHPDVGACFGLLKNKDKEGNEGNGWANDPMKLELNKEFLKLRKKIEEMKLF